MSWVGEEISSQKSVIKSAEQTHDTFFAYDLGEYSLVTTILIRQKSKKEERDIKEEEQGSPAEECKTDETDTEEVVDEIGENKVDYKRNFL